MKYPFEERTSITLTSHGQKVFAILHLPLKPGKHPVVLFCNGLGGHKSGKFRLSVRQAELLAQKGIASLRFDYRGTGDSEGSFNDITVQSQLDDAKVAIDFLKAEPTVDSARIGAIGRSFGGAILSMLTEYHPFQTAALWAPLFDATPWLLEGRKHHDIKFEAENGVSFAGFSLHPAFLNELKSLDVQPYLHSLQKTPLLIVQGLHDQIMGLYHAQKYLAARSLAQAETSYYELAKSGHDFEVPEEQELLLKKTSDWFLKHFDSGAIL